MTRVPLVLVLVSSCTPRHPPEAATPKPVAIDVPPTPPVAPPAEDPIVRDRADDAVLRLASLLGDVDDQCRTRWEADEDACGGAPFAPIAEAYAAFYSAHEDPRIQQGPVDALPRLGADHAPADVLVARMGRACEDRCGTARRLAVAEALPTAVDACAERDRAGDKACQALAKGKASNSAVREAIDHCEARCETAREVAHERFVRAQSRPRNPAEREACLRKCVGRKGGAKLVYEGGELHAEATGFCGTPAVTCEFNCAVR